MTNIGTNNEIVRQKRTYDDLRRLQGLPLEQKVQLTQLRINQWVDKYGVDGVYVSRSGGKDSDVLGDIVKKMYPEIPHVFIDTGLEYPSVRSHAIDECGKDNVLKPDMNFSQIITKYGYPVISKAVSNTIDLAKKNLASGKTDTIRVKMLNGTLLKENGEKSVFNKKRYRFLLDAPFNISSQCCIRMKEKPAKIYAKANNRKPFLGTMAEESMFRKKAWIENGCNGFNMKTPVSTPLSFWTEQDILQYILKYNLDISDAYGEIVPIINNDGTVSDELVTTKANRTGCIFCMFGILNDTDRFVKLKEECPNIYNYVMRGGKFDDDGMWVPDKGLGYKFVIDWLNEHGNLKIKY